MHVWCWSAQLALLSLAPSHGFTKPRCTCSACGFFHTRRHTCTCGTKSLESDRPWFKALRRKLSDSSIFLSNLSTEAITMQRKKKTGAISTQREPLGLQSSSLFVSVLPGCEKGSQSTNPRNCPQLEHLTSKNQPVAKGALNSRMCECCANPGLFSQQCHSPHFRRMYSVILRSRFRAPVTCRPAPILALPKQIMESHQYLFTRIWEKMESHKYQECFSTSQTLFSRAFDT